MHFCTPYRNPYIDPNSGNNLLHTFIYFLTIFTLVLFIQYMDVLYSYFIEII